MLNSVALMGRMVATPELRETADGTAVLNFRLAVDKPYNKTTKTQDASFIDCVAWKAKAETIGKFFKKGDRIVVTGSIQTRNYLDKNGNNRTSVEVLVSDFTFVEKKETAENAPKQETPFASLSDEDEEIPF